MRPVPGSTMRSGVLHDRRGVTIVEFALVAPTLLLLILGGINLGHTLYVRSVLDGEMQKASRDFSLEDAYDTKRQIVIEDRVRTAVQIVMASADVTFGKTAYHDYKSADARQEHYTDGNHDGACDNSEAYIDANNNARWDAETGVAGVGGAKDVVLLTAIARYPDALAAKFFGTAGIVELKSSTLLRNQPSADQAAAPQRNCI